MKVLLIFAILLISTGCQEYSKDQESKKTEKHQAGTDYVSGEISDWVDAINSKNIHLVKDFYRAESIKIISSDSILSSAGNIAEYYAGKSENILSIASLYTVEANRERNINYEITEYGTQNGQRYAQLLIWQLENGNRTIEFEFVSRMSKAAGNHEESISESRDLWVALCNAHNPENLVNTLYSADNIYFNHKPLIKGRENLIEEYSYMENENYQLMLDPLNMVFINDHLVYEIGQCKGSYNGKYIIVWKKESDGVWRVFIDSNV